MNTCQRCRKMKTYRLRTFLAISVVHHLIQLKVEIIRKTIFPDEVKQYELA